jgi:hypothetical protein
MANQLLDHLVGDSEQRWRHLKTERPADVYFASRRVQFATLAARHGIAAAGFNREFVEVGVIGLTCYRLFLS